MDPARSHLADIDSRIAQLFALVADALSKATTALLTNDVAAGTAVVESDQTVDDLTADVELMVWSQIEEGPQSVGALRHLVAILLILPELERSGDLAEHIAQRAVTNIGADMSPLSQGIVRRMAEVALEMWQGAADAYADRVNRADSLSEDDEELDILHDRLTNEIAAETMPTAVGVQVTLVARFYERLGDHAVDLARRIEMFQAHE
jgi:phosphate transport system protein